MLTADVSAEQNPIIETTFTEDWSTVSEGHLCPGCSLVVQYHAKRLVENVSNDVSGDYYVEVSFRKKGRPVAKRLLPTESPDVLRATVEVPAYCRELAMWFKVCRPDGKWDYDSNSGMNYVFPVRGNAVMFFPVNEDVRTSGNLTPGGILRLYYDSHRLPGRDFYLGQPSWDIQAAAIFREFGQVTRKVMQPASDDVDPIMITEYEIPRDAQFVSVWFKHWGHFSGDTYDTNGGHNYVQSFQYDGEICFSKDMTTIVKGFLLGGSKVCVWYHTDRIFEKVSKKATPSAVTKSRWLKVHVMFERDGAVTVHDLGEVRRDDLVKTVLDIPMDAGELVLWFSYGAPDGDEIDELTSSFDSCFGQNYHFEILN